MTMIALVGMHVGRPRHEKAGPAEDEGAGHLGELELEAVQDADRGVAEGDRFERVTTEERLAFGPEQVRFANGILDRAVSVDGEVGIEKATRAVFDESGQQGCARGTAAVRESGDPGVVKPQCDLVEGGRLVPRQKELREDHQVCSACCGNTLSDPGEVAFEIP